MKNNNNVQHTFFVHFFAVVLHDYILKLPETSWFRFMEEMSYMFLFTFFLLPLIFTLHWWPLAFLILSPPLQNFHVVLPTKKNTSFIIFLSLALGLCCTFSHGASLACHILSLFLCLSLALYSEFGDMTINLSLTL